MDYALGYRDPLPPRGPDCSTISTGITGRISGLPGACSGQTCGLIPSLNMAFAITAADRDYTAMRLFQREVVDRMKADDEPPAQTPAAGADPFEDILLQKGLRMTLKGKNVSVKHHLEPKQRDLVFRPEDNPDKITCVELHFTEDGELIYVMEDERGRHEVRAGLDRWVDGTTTMTGGLSPPPV